MTTPHTILLSDDGAVTTALTDAFGSDALLTPMTPVTTLDELAALLALRPSGLVVVDIQPDPEQMIESLSELIPDYPECRFVVIADSFDKQVLLAAMQAGARHYLPKDWIGPDIVPICRELAQQVAEPEAPTDAGRVITVLSASGGCGATTIAANLAAELGQLAQQRALLVDFDLRYGGMATQLGVSGEYGLADLLAREGPLDADLVRSTAVERGEWLDVLLSPSSINFAEPAPLYLDELQQTLGVFRAGYDTTIIDAPGLPFEATSALAKYSDEILIVFNLSVKDLRNTRLLLEALGKLGIDANVHLLANRCRGNGKIITLSDAQDTLEFDGEIRPLIDDPAGATASLHAGEPMLQAAASSKLRKQLLAFAHELRGDEAAEQKKPRFGQSKRKAA